MLESCDDRARSEKRNGLPDALGEMVREEGFVSGLCFEHRFPKAGIDDMDIFELRLFLLVAEDFLQVSYRHAIIDIVRAEGVPEGMDTGFSHPGLFVILSDKFADTAWI
jgi:hypothetical protein